MSMQECLPECLLLGKTVARGTKRIKMYGDCVQPNHYVLTNSDGYNSIKW
jgi:hypothetical protein